MASRAGEDESEGRHASPSSGSSAGFARGRVGGGANERDSYESPLLRPRSQLETELSLMSNDTLYAQDPADDSEGNETGSLVSDRKFESLEMLDFSEDFGHLHRANNFAYFKQSTGPPLVASKDPARFIRENVHIRMPLEEIYGSQPRQRLVTPGRLDEIFTPVGDTTHNEEMGGDTGSGLERTTSDVHMMSMINACAASHTESSLALAADVARMLGEELEDTFGRGLLQEAAPIDAGAQTASTGAMPGSATRAQNLVEESAAERKASPTSGDPSASATLPSSATSASTTTGSGSSGILSQMSSIVTRGRASSFSGAETQRAHRGLPAPTWVAGRVDPAGEGATAPQPPEGFKLYDGSDLVPHPTAGAQGTTTDLDDETALEVEIAKKRADANRVLSLAHVRFLESHWPMITRLVICALIAIVTSCIGWIIEFLSATLYNLLFRVMNFFLRQTSGPLAVWVIVASIAASAIVLVYSIVAVSATYVGGFYPMRGSGLAHLVAYLDGSYDPRLPFFTPSILICKPISITFALACGVKSGLQAPLVHTGGLIGKQLSRMLTKVLASDLFAQVLMFFCCCCVDSESRCRPPWTRRGLAAFCDWCRAGACFRRSRASLASQPEVRLRKDRFGYSGLDDEDLAAVQSRAGPSEISLSRPSSTYLSPSLSQHASGNVSFPATPLPPPNAFGGSTVLGLPTVPSAFAGSNQGDITVTLAQPPDLLNSQPTMLFEYQRHQRNKSKFLVGDSTHPLDVALGLRAYATQELDLDLRLDDDIEQMLLLADSSSRRDESASTGAIQSIRDNLPSVKSDGSGPSTSDSLAEPTSMSDARDAAWQMTGLSERPRAQTVHNPFLTTGGSTASSSSSPNHLFTRSPSTKLEPIEQGDEEADEDEDVDEETVMLADASSNASSRPTPAASPKSELRSQASFLAQRTARSTRAVAHGDKSVSSIVFERTSALARNRHMNTISAGFLTSSASPTTEEKPQPPPVPMKLDIPSALTLLSSAIRGPNDEHDFIACGAVAGFTAAFNSPLAAVVMVQGFARAGTSLKLTLRLFWAALFAVLTSNLLDASSSVLPDRGFIDLDISKAVKLNAREVGVCIFIGLFGGLLGAGLTKVNLLIQGWRRKFGHQLKENFIYTFAVAVLSNVPGLILAASMSCKSYSDTSFPVCLTHPDRCLRMACPPGQFSQVGTLFFSFPDRLVRVLWNRDPLNGEYDLSVMFVFLIGYSILSCAFYMAALPGGFFVPSIAIGAAFGRLAGRLVSELGGEVNLGVYAVLGSTALLASINRYTLPIAVMMVEFTSDAQFLVPIMIVVLLSKYVADNLIGSMESEEMKMKGANLSLGQTPHPVLTRVTAKDLMATRYPDPTINWSKLAMTNPFTPHSANRSVRSTSAPESSSPQNALVEQQESHSRLKQMAMYKRIILADLQIALTRLPTSANTLLARSPLPRCPAAPPPPLAGWAAPLAFNDVCCLGEVETLARIRAVLAHTTHQSFPVVTVIPHISREFFKSHAFSSSLSVSTRNALPGVGVFLGVVERTQLEALLTRAADSRRIERSAVILRRREIVVERTEAKRKAAIAAWNALIATEPGTSNNDAAARRTRELILQSVTPTLPPSHRLFSTPFVYFPFAIQALSRDKTSRSRMLLMAALIYRVQLAKYLKSTPESAVNPTSALLPPQTVQRLLAETVDYIALSVFLPPLPRTVASALVSIRRAQWAEKRARDLNYSAELGVSMARAQSAGVNAPKATPVYRTGAAAQVENAEIGPSPSPEDVIAAELSREQTFKERCTARLERFATWLESRAEHVTEPKIKGLQPLTKDASATSVQSSPRSSATIKIHPDDVTKWVNLLPFVDRGAYTVSIDTSGHRIWRQFRLIGMRRLVVLDAFHRPVGFITRKDMVVAEQTLMQCVRDEAEEFERYSEDHY